MKSEGRVVGDVNPVIVKDSADVPVIPVTLRVVGVAMVQLPVNPTKELHVRAVGVRLGAKATRK